MLCAVCRDLDSSTTSAGCHWPEYHMNTIFCARPSKQVAGNRLEAIKGPMASGFPSPVWRIASDSLKNCPKVSAGVSCTTTERYFSAMPVACSSATSKPVKTDDIRRNNESCGVIDVDLRLEHLQLCVTPTGTRAPNDVLVA